jgi:hypothetical protein
MICPIYLSVPPSQLSPESPYAIWQVFESRTTSWAIIGHQQCAQNLSSTIYLTDPGSDKLNSVCPSSYGDCPLPPQSRLTIGYRCYS